MRLGPTLLAFACAIAGAIGCAPRPTTVVVAIDAAPGTLVQSLLLRVDVPGGAAESQALPAAGGVPSLPGRAVVKLPDVVMDVTVALDGQSAGGDVLHAETVVRTIPHAAAWAELTLGGTRDLGAGDVDLGGDDLGAPADLAGADMACTLGARCAYAYRRVVSIFNGSGSALPAGYTLRVPLDATAFPAGKVRADLNDVRLFDESGGGVEKNRVIDGAPPGQGRAMWIRLVRSVAAGATDTSYAIYYGDATAGAPPANAALVFPLYDGFDSGAAPASPPWTPNDGPTVGGGNLLLRRNTQDAVRTGFAGDGVPTLSALEWRMRVTDTGSAGQTVSTYGTFWYWAGYQEQDSFTPADPWVVWIARSPGTDLHGARKVASGTACSAECVGPTIAPDTNFHVYRIERGPSQTRWYRDGVMSYSVDEVNDTDWSVMLRNFAVTSDMLVDWVRARALASPEPTVTVGAEQPVP